MEYDQCLSALRSQRHQNASVAASVERGQFETVAWKAFTEYVVEEPEGWKLDDITGLCALLWAKVYEYVGPEAWNRIDCGKAAPSVLGHRFLLSICDCIERYCEGRSSLEPAEVGACVRVIARACEDLDLEGPRKFAFRVMGIPSWWALGAAARSQIFAADPSAKGDWEKTPVALDKASNLPPVTKGTPPAQFSSLLLWRSRGILVVLLRRLLRAARNDSVLEEDLLVAECVLELLVAALSQAPIRRTTRPVTSALKLFIRLDTSAMRRRCPDLLRRASELDGLFLDGHFGRDQRLRSTALLVRLMRENQEEMAGLRKIARVAADVDQQRDNLVAALNQLSTDRLQELGISLGSFTTAEMELLQQEKLEPVVLRETLLELIGYGALPKETWQERIRRTNILPNEISVWAETIAYASDPSSSAVIALPRLGIQFLHMRDLLLRNFDLLRIDSLDDVRQTTELAICQMKPRQDPEGTGLVFQGSSKMATPILASSLILVVPPIAGERVPQQVRGEIAIDLKLFDFKIRQEWDELRPGDLLTLVQLAPPPPSVALPARVDEIPPDADFPTLFSVLALRGCEVLEVLDEEGNVIRPDSKRRPAGTKRSIRTLLEPMQYLQDAGAEKSDNIFMADEGIQVQMYEAFNLCIRRKPESNNFKGILSSMRDMLLSSESLVMPAISDLVLGFDNHRISRPLWNTPSTQTFVFGGIYETVDEIRRCFSGAEEIVVKSDKAPFQLTFESDCSLTSKQAPGCLMPKLHRVIIDCASKEVPNYRRTVCPTSTQATAIRSGLNPGLTMIVGPPGTGKTDTAVQLVSCLLQNFPEERIVIVARSNQALNDFFSKVCDAGIEERYLLRLGMGERELAIAQDEMGDGNGARKDFSKFGRVDYVLQERAELLRRLGDVCSALGIFVDSRMLDSQRAALIEEFPWKPTCAVYAEQWRRCVALYDQGKSSLEAVISMLESSDNTASQHLKDLRTLVHSCASQLATTKALTTEGKFGDKQISFAELLFPLAGLKEAEALFAECETEVAAFEQATEFLKTIDAVFERLHEYRSFELLRTTHARSEYLTCHFSRVIAMTSTHAALARSSLAASGFQYETLIVEEAAQMLDIETVVSTFMQQAATRLKRVVLLGDHLQLSPVVQNRTVAVAGNLQQSFFMRMIRLGIPYCQLDAQGRCRSSIGDLFRWRYEHPGLGDLPHVAERPEFLRANHGFTYTYQLVECRNASEVCVAPHVYQNAEEANFAVALFAYMRLKGYPQQKITILTTYNGQKRLIKRILAERCSWNPLIGSPHKVTTLDKFQGQQNDYVILSMVRTKAIGYMASPERMTVAFSRARLGLYVLGRLELFSRVGRLRRFFASLMKRPHQLMVVPSEQFGKDPAREELAFAPGTPVDSSAALWQLVKRCAEELLSPAQAPDAVSA